MGNFARRVPGNYPSLTADELNAMLEVAQAFRRGKLASLLAGTDIGAWKPANIVYVQNGTGGDLSARAIVTASDVAIDPATDPAAASTGPAVEASAPASATDPVLIVLDGIADGNVGRAAVSGVTVAQVSVSSTSHRFARPIPGTTSHLASAASGPVRLLVPPAASGTQMAYVLLGGGSSSSGDGTGGDCIGDGWRIGLTAEDEWALRVVGQDGTVFLEDGATVEINGIEYTIDFAYGTPSLVLDPGGYGTPKTGTLDCTACPCFQFAFERKDFFPEEPVAENPCDRILYVAVCKSCPAGWYCARIPGIGAPYQAVELDAGEACGSSSLDIAPGGPYASSWVAEEACPGSQRVECCPDVDIPGTWCVTKVSTGDFGTKTTTHTVTYHADSHNWYFVDTEPGPGQGGTWIFTCEPFTNSWLCKFITASQAQKYAVQPDDFTWSCDPFEIHFTGAYFNGDPIGPLVTDVITVVPGPC